MSSDETKPKPSLLVVDDDKQIRRLLVRIAERAGFEVECAKDGLEGLEMIEKKDYLIAIVDLMMPRLSGYELVQKISMRKPRPTVLVATAMTNGDVASLDDSMVRRVIKKPFDVEAVAHALIETAQQIASERATSEEPVSVPSDGGATISVAVAEPPPDEAAEPQPMAAADAESESASPAPITDPPPDEQR